MNVKLACERPHRRCIRGTTTAGVVAVLVFASRSALAEGTTTAPSATAPSATAPSAAAPSATAPSATAPSAAAPSATVPSASAPDECGPATRFSADPISDGALLAASLGFAGLSEAIISTGEIRPQQIEATFDTHHLLPLDRSALTQSLDLSADSFSNGGLYTAIGFATLDSVLSGFRFSREAALTDATMYAEAVAFSWGLTNLAKIGFRRPRPIAYIERERAITDGQDPATYNNPSTDSTLSFYSGHTSITATISATAIYLSFARSPHSMRSWATLAGGTLLTSFVAVERVRSGAHFPTDVIAGALAGAGVGLLVVHLHRQDTETRKPVWVGALPLQGGGGVTVGGRF